MPHRTDKNRKVHKVRIIMIRLLRLLPSGLSRAKVAKAVYSVTCSHQHLAGYAVTTTTTTWAGCPFEAIAPIWLQPGGTFSMANSHMGS